MANYVLVHGAWHGGWCYRETARILRGAGHSVFTPTLTGTGAGIRPIALSLCRGTRMGSRNGGPVAYS